MGSSWVSLRLLKYRAAEQEGRGAERAPSKLP